jgi:hypothetical protein
MPKRVLVSSLKVKRLIKLFDSSPSKMAKGKKTGTSAGAALAHKAEELGREEAAANDQAAPAANMSSMGMVALFQGQRTGIVSWWPGLTSRGGSQAEKVQRPPAQDWRPGIFKPQREVARPQGWQAPPRGARPPWPSLPS